jgi:tRNA pseudouridine55 synthase
MVLNPKNPKLDPENGNLILVDKPADWTSFDVVNKIRFPLRRWSGKKNFKVGHAGTLDPFATGLLLVCIGKMTKQINTYMGLPKCYSGVIRLGETTPSFDTETEVDQRQSIEHLNEEEIQKAESGFIGKIEQKPPMYSALKKDGKRLYELARKGEEVEVKARTVEISKFDLTHIDLPEVHFFLRCSKGTYVRSLARDLGEKLGVGAHLTRLRREQIGDFQLEEAWELNKLAEFLNSQADHARIQRPD